MGVLSDDFVIVGLFRKWCQRKNILSSRRLSDTCAEAFVVLGRKVSYDDHGRAREDPRLAELSTDATPPGGQSIRRSARS